MKFFLPNEKDKQLIQFMLEQVRNLPAVQSAARTASPVEHLNAGLMRGPDTYIALPPEGGIPALTSAGSTGTGGEPASGDAPGYADCQIYRIVYEGDTDYALRKLEKSPQRVFNISSTEIGYDWTLVTRVKEGYWVAIVGGGDTAPWEFATLDQDLVAGFQPDGYFATVTDGLTGASTGVKKQLYHSSHTLSSGTTVVVSFKRGKWYCIPYDCPETPGTGTDS